MNNELRKLLERCRDSAVQHGDALLCRDIIMFMKKAEEAAMDTYLVQLVNSELIAMAEARPGNRNQTLYKSLRLVLPEARTKEERDYAVRELSSAAKLLGLTENEIARTISGAELG